MRPKIGVFDSGMGGLSVAQAIERALPEYEIIFSHDAEHLPYGSKSPEELLGYVVPKLTELVDEGCELIVIACNTVTTNLITELRERTSVPLIGMEPMIKPAAEQTKSKVIAVCATPTTLASQRYQWLIETYAADLTVLEPDCSDWASMIEKNAVEQHQISALIDEACNMNADVIVLGCTHYHWIEDQIREIAAGRAEVLQPEQPVIEEVKHVLATQAQARTS